MAVTIMEIADAIADTLVTATGILTKQSFDELSEGINNKDCPLIQVYLESLQMDPEGNTAFSSFAGDPPVEPMRQKLLTFHVDLFTSRRNHIAQNWREVHENVDAILDVLEAQERHPYFGFVDPDKVKAYQLESATRALLDYGGPDVTYPGFRFVLLIRVF